MVFDDKSSLSPLRIQITVIVQSTGGRAGGHHSYEEFRQPIFATDGLIRSQPNISLVAGSGFGDGEGEGVWPYITGKWALEYGVQPMPFDDVLFGSWAMIAKEAHASDRVTQLLVQAPGVYDDLT
jgi:enoyl reductase-like protein